MLAIHSDKVEAIQQQLTGIAQKLDRPKISDSKRERLSWLYKHLQRKFGDHARSVSDPYLEEALLERDAVIPGISIALI